MLLTEKNHIVQLRMYGKENSTLPFTTTILTDRSSGQMDFSFRYVRMKIYSMCHYRTWGLLQFSRLQFYDDSNNVFEYGSNWSINSKNGEEFNTGNLTLDERYSGEGLEQILTTDQNHDHKKVCADIKTTPIFINLDLKSARLNVKKYKHWRFFNSWDTSSEGRIAEKFELFVSYDGIKWYSADDTQKNREYGKDSIPTANWAEQYHGDIKIKFDS